MGQDCQFLLGVYTGDIVKDATEKDWDEVDEEIAEVFRKPIYFAPGNHDMADRELYESRYGESFHFVDVKNNRFIFLDANIDYWNITEKQLEFFNDAIRSLEEIENLFIFTHQVIWWRWDNKYRNVKLNSHEKYKAFPNYWSDIHPQLDSLDMQVYVFSGDVGAAGWASDYMYDKLDNVHLIASGMGHNDGDNFVEVVVSAGQAELKIRQLSDRSYPQLDTFTVVH